VGVLLLDENLHARDIERRRREDVNGDGEKYREKRCHRRPAALVQHADVVEQMDLRFAEHVAAIPVARRVLPDAARSGFGRATGRRVIDRSRVEWNVVGHQKNLSRTMIVSPGCTMSPNFTSISFLLPFTMRTILIRVVDPRSVSPPASDKAC